MKLLLEIVGSLVLLLLAAFCVLGYLATSEPTNNPGQFLAFRVGYSFVGVCCLVGIGFLIVNVLRK